MKTVAQESAFNFLLCGQILLFPVSDSPLGDGSVLLDDIAALGMTVGNRIRVSIHRENIRIVFIFIQTLVHVFQKSRCKLDVIFRHDPSVGFLH